MDWEVVAVLGALGAFIVFLVYEILVDYGIIRSK